MAACVMVSSFLPFVHSFVPISKQSTPTSAAGRVPFDPMHRRSTQLFAEALQEIESMRAGEIRKELESYGISCKSFFEKSELVDALKKARAEGKTPINGAKVNDDASASSSTASSGASTSSGGTADSGASRDEKIKAEMEKCKAMKVGDLKKELQSLGVSTKSFFEKSEFVKALAEARVDGVKKRGGAGQGFGRGSSQPQEEDEPYDPSYRDVVMQKMNVDPRDPRMGRGPLIDIKLGR